MIKSIAAATLASVLFSSQVSGQEHTKQSDYEWCMTRPFGTPSLMYPGTDYNYQILNRGYRFISRDKSAHDCRLINVVYIGEYPLITFFQYLSEDYDVIAKRVGVEEFEIDPRKGEINEDFVNKFNNMLSSAPDVAKDAIHELDLNFLSNNSAN